MKAVSQGAEHKMTKALKLYYYLLDSAIRKTYDEHVKPLGRTYLELREGADESYFCNWINALMTDKLHDIKDRKFKEIIKGNKNKTNLGKVRNPDRL